MTTNTKPSAMVGEIENAKACGHLLAAMMLMVPALHSHLSKSPSSGGKPQNKQSSPNDFALLLKELQRRTTSEALVRLAGRAEVLRHRVAHQNFLFCDYPSAVDTLCRLSKAIGAPELVQRINDLAYSPQQTAAPTSSPAPSPSDPLAPSNEPNSSQPEGQPTANKKKRKKKKKKKNQSATTPTLTKGTPTTAATPSPNEPEKADQAWMELKEKGNRFFGQGKYTEAMDCYSQAIRLDSQQAVLFSNRALCELKLGKLELAREDAEDALGLDPTQVKYTRVLSEALMLMGQYEEAHSICERGLKLDPREATLLKRSRDIQAILATKSHEYHTSTTPPPTTNLFPRAKNPNTLINIPEYISMMDSVNPPDSEVEIIRPKDVNMQGAQTVLQAHQYREGKFGKPKDIEQAVKLYELAAKQGNAEGMYNFAIWISRGFPGINVDYDLSNEWLRRAAAQKPFFKIAGQLLVNIGVAEAENALGTAYRDGRGVDKDPKIAGGWFVKAARHGCLQGMNNLAMHLWENQDFKTAAVWLRKAADGGLAEAQLNLADSLAQGLGIDADLQLAQEYYQKAADQGMPGALEALQRLRRSEPAKVAKREGTQEILLERLSKNDPQALFLLARNYEQGEGGFVCDYELAAEYYSRAVEAKHPHAALPLALLHLEKLKNPELAFKFMSLAAKEGNAVAQLELSRMCAFGHGCNRDEAAARKWFQRSEGRVMVRGKLSGDTVESWIESGKDICDFENTNSLTYESLSPEERTQRWVQSETQNNTSEFSKLLSQLLSLNSMPSPTPVGIPQPMMDGFGVREIFDKANQGSITAQRYLLSQRVRIEVSVALREPNLTTDAVDDALAKLREAFDLWDITSCPGSHVLDAVEKRLKQDPKHADAGFILGQFYQGSNKERLEYWSRLASYHPRDWAIIHHLGAAYAFDQQHEVAARYFERSIKAKPEKTDWLYSFASSLRLLATTVRQKRNAIAAYQEFLEKNPKDHRKVPEALYSLGALHFELKEPLEAERYYEKGMEAELPANRLSCLGPVADSFPPKMMLSMLHTVKQASRANY